MSKEFVPHEQALELKELGFEEPCFGVYVENELVIVSTERPSIQSHSLYQCLAPLYQQAFRWFRERYGLYSVIFPNTHGQVVWCIRWYVNGVQKDTPYLGSYTYEEAELACLKKLIEIVKNK